MVTRVVNTNKETCPPVSPASRAAFFGPGPSCRQLDLRRERENYFSDCAPTWPLTGARCIVSAAGVGIVFYNKKNAGLLWVTLGYDLDLLVIFFARFFVIAGVPC